MAHGAQSRGKDKARGAWLFVGLLLGLCFSQSSVSGEEEAASSTGVTETIDRLKRLLGERHANETAQAKAWPQQGPEARSEAPAPPGFQKLRDAHRDIRITIAATIGELAQQTRDDSSALSDSLRGGAEADYLEAVLPLLMESRTSDSEAAKTVLGAALGLRPYPHFAAKALARLDSAEARLFLRERGVEEKSPLLLAASVGPGDAESLGRLIDLAEGEDPGLVRAALRAIERLEPASLQRSGNRPGLTDEQTEGELESLAPELRSLAKRSFGESRLRAVKDVLRTRAVKSRQARVKASLITCLGLFQDPGDSAFLRARFEESRDEAVPPGVRIVGAWGRIPSSGEHLLKLAEAPETSPAVRRACILALGAVKHLAAVPFLLDHVEDPECALETSRTLERLAGRRFGSRKSDWLRWWRTQPEAASTETDPDLIATEKK